MTAYTSFSLSHEAVSAWKERRRRIEDAEAAEFARTLVGAHDAWERTFGPGVPQPASWEQATVTSWARTQVDGLAFVYKPPLVLSDPADADRPGTINWVRPADKELLEVDSLERLGQLLILAGEGEYVYLLTWTYRGDTFALVRTDDPLATEADFEARQRRGYDPELFERRGNDWIRIRPEATSER